jgi:hypothetical protein
MNAPANPEVPRPSGGFGRGYRILSKPVQPQ